MTQIMIETWNVNLHDDWNQYLPKISRNILLFPILCLFSTLFSLKGSQAKPTVTLSRQEIYESKHTLGAKFEWMTTL